MSILEIVEAEAEKIGDKGSAFPLLPQVRPTAIAQLRQLHPGTQVALVSVWHYALPDERAFVFLEPDHQAGKQRLRADLIHQLFPRSTLLTERHRRATACGEEFTRLSVEIDENAPTYVNLQATWPDARLVISARCWDEILPRTPDFLGDFNGTVERLHQVLLEAPRNQWHHADQNWHHVVDAGRTLREEHANRLHWCRRQVGSNAGPLILDAVKAMADMEQVSKCRHREFPDIPQTALQPEDIKLFEDAETIDDFLGLLQALRCYMNTTRQLVSWLHKTDEGHQAIGVLAVSTNVTRLNGNGPVTSTALSDVYEHSFFRSMNVALRKQQTETNGTHYESPCLPKDIAEEITKWFVGDQVQASAASWLVAVAKELAEKCAVHEGRQLHYRFVYASSAAIWPEIEEVLSYEAAAYHPAGRPVTVETQAKTIEAHWSIFQPERVFAVFDMLARGRTAPPRIQRVVRVRAPVRWSGLESEAMDSLAKAGRPSLVVSVLRQWIVRLAFSRNGETVETLTWDVRNPAREKETNVSQLAHDLAHAVGIEGNRVQRVLQTVLSEVSETQGEGALLIAVGNGNVQEVVKKTCLEMDRPEDRMAWRNKKQLRWVDRTLLRAMLIMDGAAVIEPTTRTDAVVRPRLVVYPYVLCPSHPGKSGSFSVISWEPPPNARGCSCPRPDAHQLEKIRNKLVGKGSRTHGAANIAVLLKQARGASFVVSVSADGPIKEWPTEGA